MPKQPILALRGREFAREVADIAGQGAKVRHKITRSQKPLSGSRWSRRGCTD